MKLKSFEGVGNPASKHNSQPWNFLWAMQAMELQAIAGLQQGICCGYRNLRSATTQRWRRIESAPTLGNPSVQSRVLVAGEPRIGRAAGVVVSSSSSSGGGDGSGETDTEVKKAVLKIGSPVVITQAPPLLKTAEPMPMLRPNNGLINVGDAGRIIDRKPKDTWAVRFAVGAYLIDRKYFEPLNL